VYSANVLVLFNSLYKFDYETSNSADVNQARIRLWDQPVLSKEGKVYSCSRKQWEHVMLFELKTNRLRVIRSEMCFSMEFCNLLSANAL